MTVNIWTFNIFLNEVPIISTMHYVTLHLDHLLVKVYLLLWTHWVWKLNFCIQNFIPIYHYIQLALPVYTIRESKIASFWEFCLSVIAHIVFSIKAETQKPVQLLDQVKWG